jgi:hypothetical protein
MDNNRSAFPPDDAPLFVLKPDRRLHRRIHIADGDQPDLAPTGTLDFGMPPQPVVDPKPALEPETDARLTESQPRTDALREVAVALKHLTDWARLITRRVDQLERARHR